jgi:hypothetical protein
MASAPTGARAADIGAQDFSLVLEGPLYDAQRAARLMPPGRFGMGRRIALFVAIGWLPLALWALLNRRVFEGAVAEPMLQHFGVHVRFLVAVPLFLLAEPLAEAIGRGAVSYFLTSGLVPETERAAFTGAVERARQLMRSRVALTVIAGIVLTLAVTGTWTPRHPHELQWTLTADRAGLHPSFASWWFLWVSLPLYRLLLLSWLWRVVVLTVLLWRLSRLDLQLVATHTDRCGGLGFIERLPGAFAPVIAGTSIVLAGGWGHDVLYHGTPLASLRLPAALHLVLMLVLFLAPLLVFAPRLAALKRQSVLAYGALVGRHGRLVERRWLRGQAVDDDGLLSAPELGPVADTLTLYQAVSGLRVVPIGKQALLTVVGAAVVPMIPVVAIQIPVKDQLLSVLKMIL